MTDDKNPPDGADLNKKLIERFIKDKGGLRPAATFLGIPHSNLVSLRNEPKTFTKYKETAEKIRKELGIHKSEFWEQFLGRKVD